MSELEAYITTMQQMEAAVRRLAARIDAPERYLPSMTTYEDYDSARPHLDLQEDGFNWVIAEHGQVLERVVTRDASEILWLIFSHVALDMAIDYEFAGRAAGVDTGGVIHGRELELLAQLNPAWAKRREQEWQANLEQHASRDDQRAEQADQPDSPERHDVP